MKTPKDENQEEPYEIYRGHVDQCLKHLGRLLEARAPRGSRAAPRAKQPMADFCDVTVASVNRWLRLPNVSPVGEQHIKAICYLDVAGYRVIELEKMKQGHRGVFELIGFGLISSLEVTKLLDYKNVSALYDILFSRVGTSEDKKEKMWNLWVARREELKQTKEQAEKKYRIEDLPAVSKATRPPGQSTKKSLPLIKRWLPAIKAMECLDALLESGGLQDINPADIAELQPSTQTILGLAAKLSTIGSELITTGQQKGGS